jgi:hypothetical protein
MMKRTHAGGLSPYIAGRFEIPVAKVVREMSEDRDELIFIFENVVCRLPPAAGPMTINVKMTVAAGRREGMITSELVNLYSDVVWVMQPGTFENWMTGELR